MKKCCNCKIMVHDIQCYNVLTFPLEEIIIYKQSNSNYVDILDGFEYYQREEHLNGANKIYCNNCRNMENSCRQSKIISSPKILIIILNRRKNSRSKIKLTFAEYLNIKQFVNNCEIPTHYKLIGVISQLDPSEMPGRFIAYCKCSVESCWKQFNDSEVDYSSFEDVTEKGTPCVLFYSKDDK